MNIFETFTYAFFAGLLPALVWLWFWLHEDSKHPEPRSTLAFTFLTGMAMIFLAIPLESIFSNYTQSGQFLAWATVEEILKFIVFIIVALHAKSYDEPIDAVIYMICAALGFAALENTLFITNSINNSANVVSNVNANILTGVFIANLRFIGANLLHVVASSAIGIALALSFYKTKIKKVIWIVGGLIIAIILHTFFNLFIIGGSSNDVFLVFSIVWLTMIGFVLIFEKIKKMRVPVK
jgi:RsiW-degrading membrane proteinase PrsW (M82 family)